MDPHGTILDAGVDECVVCGMTTDAKSRITREYLGGFYCFCSEKCLGDFLQDPESFIQEEENND